MASFGAFEVDLATGVLRKCGIRLRLPEQSFQLLALLLDHTGSLVSREDMKHRLWPAGTYVDFDHGVNKAINRLRQVLGDSATHPRFIETVPRRGYRFLVALNGQDREQLDRGPAKLRLAVLPFENMSGDPDQDYFAEGLTEELTVQLGQVHPQRLGIIARAVASPRKNGGTPVYEIAKDLNLDFILQGSVRRCRDRVRVSSQLIEVSDHTCVWAENYERSLSDAFVVQSEVARIISQVVAFTVLGKRDEPRTDARTEFQKWISAFENDDPATPTVRPV